MGLAHARLGHIHGWGLTVHRIDHATRAVNLNGPGKDGFTGGDPLTQVAPTTVTPDFLNAVQEEIANAIGLVSAPVKAQNNQLANALTLMLDAVALGTMNRSTGPDVLASGMANDGDGLTIVAAGGTPAAYDDALMYSLDGGRTFTIATFAAPRTFMAWIAWGNGLFVAVGLNGDIRTSPDGITWTKRTPGGGFAGAFRRVIYASGLGL